MTNIYEEIRKDFQIKIGRVPDDSRKRESVEMRAALSNAMHPFCHFRNISSLWGRDRTSIYHYVRNHEMYYTSSSDYRAWYSAANEVVKAKLELIPPRELTHEGKLELSPHAEIDTITNTIRVLQEFKRRIEARLRRGKPSSLQNVRTRSVANDGKNMGRRKVRRIL
ncbi:MAG: hypothetical protein P8J32_07340 [bacterium]|nr:hypothetical protein [bacterium]